MEKLHSPQDLEHLRATCVASLDSNKPCVTVCSGTGCLASGCKQVTTAFSKELERGGLAGKVEVRITGCHGFCERGPLVVIKPQAIFYQQVELKDVAEVVEETFGQGNVIDRLLYTHPQTGEKITYERDVPFYQLQKRLILADNGFIDPTCIEDYIARGGYSALAQALTRMSRKRSLTRSRGRDCAAGAAAVSRPGASGKACRNAKGEPNTSSATPTKATPARTWTAACWRAIPTACSRE